jgi:hypothetical protein
MTYDIGHYFVLLPTCQTSIYQSIFILEKISADQLDCWLLSPLRMVVVFGEGEGKVWLFIKLNPFSLQRGL